MIAPQEIHVWSAKLALMPQQLAHLFTLLSQDEKERAQRFHFTVHQQRFIAARGILRQLLGNYLATPPQTIRFAYNAQQKPYLAFPTTSLQFNLSHSHDYALYAFTLKHPIGIDIEKIEPGDKTDLAERFFSPTENAALALLSPPQRMTAFFNIWSRKEALLKALGKGLSIPLSTFSVSAEASVETITLEHIAWSLLSITAPTGYAAALATSQPIEHISYYNSNLTEV